MTFHLDGLLSNRGGRFQVVIFDVAESHYLPVLDVAIFEVTTPHSCGADGGDLPVLTGSKGVAAHCEPMERPKAMWRQCSKASEP
jgi:hypothetical protein